MAIEMEIVALLARGDIYDTIRETILSKYNRSISAGVITAIKKRNPEALATIQSAIIQKEKDNAEALLLRSRRLLGKKLRDAEQGKESIRVNELTSISHEMFHQHRTESGLGDGANSGASGGDPKEKLKQLQSLLDENDEVRLERIIFAKRDADRQVFPLNNEPEPGGRAGDGVRVQGASVSPPDNPDGEEVETPQRPPQEG